METKQRICLVNLDYTPYRSSGLAVHGETLVAGLVKHGHNVVVVTRYRPGLPRTEIIDGVKVIRVGSGHGDWIGFSLAAGPAVSRLHAAQPFDLIYFVDVHFAANFRGPFVAGLLQSFRQRLTSDNGQPYHTGWTDLAFRSVYYRMARLLAEKPSLNRARHLISISQATADEFISFYGIEPERISVIPTGIDLDRLQPRDVASLRQRLGLIDKRVLLFVGFCSPRKGLEYLAQAMHSMPEDVYWVVAGRWNSDYRARVLEELGPHRDRLIEVGYVSDDELPYYYSLADLFVLPSLLEGFGIPICEALACGTPVITTSAGAAAETAGPGAVVVPPRDGAALAEAILGLLDAPEERQRLAQAGRMWVRERYSINAMTRAYEAVYRRFAQ